MPYLMVEDLESRASIGPTPLSLWRRGLSGPFRGLFKLRLGDYYVIYSKTQEVAIILRTRHRSKAYR